MQLAAFVLVFLITKAASSENDPDITTDIPPDDFGFEEKMGHFKDEYAVREFRKYLDRGFVSKGRQFNMRDPEIRDETIAIIDLLFSAIDDNTFVDLIWWIFEKISFEQFAYVSTILLINRQVPGIRAGDLLPTWYVTHPNYFVPNRILQKIKSDVEEGTYNSSDVPLLVPDHSDPTAYFMDDPDLHSMFYTWNLYFPTWMDPRKYGLYDWPARGELFYDFHNQLSTAYYLRSGKRKTPWLSQWEEPIKEGYATELVNSAGRPFSSRSENIPKHENNNYRRLKEIYVKIRTIVEKEIIYVNESYCIPLNESAEVVPMASILSNIVYNTPDSVNPSYYGSFYDTAVSYLASLGSDPNEDGGGLAGHPMTALRDPAFYQLLDYINAVVAYYKKWMRPEDENEMISDEDLSLVSMEVGPLETFFEPVDIDLRVWLGRHEEAGKYVVRQLRLNHEPFALRFNLSNSADEPKPALISVFLAKHFFRSDIDEDIYQPIDRFKTIVNPGINVIERDISESKIFADGKPLMIPCGIPKTLLLPKGTEEGLKMNMFAIITPYVDSDDTTDEPDNSGYVKSPLCGNLRLNYGRSFGFLMDRSTSESLPFQMFAYYNVSIYHRRNTFQGGITI